MEKELKTTLNSQRYHWLDIAETTSVIVSIGGAVASLFVKEILLASIPFSACIAFNLVNRNRILSQINTQSSIAIAESTQKNQNDYLSLVEQLEKIKQSNNNQLAKDKTEKNNLIKQIDEVNDKFKKQTEEFTIKTQELAIQKDELATKIEHLIKIESSTRNIQSESKIANSYYERGVSHQQIGEKKRAIEDFTKVIELVPSYSLAYHNRGLVNFDLGNKKAAVEDLRKAAKFYFEQGDLENYQKTKNMSLELHELNSVVSKPDSEQLLASSLFS